MIAISQTQFDRLAEAHGRERARYWAAELASRHPEPSRVSADRLRATVSDDLAEAARLEIVDRADVWRFLIVRQRLRSRDWGHRHRLALVVLHDLDREPRNRLAYVEQQLLTERPPG